MFGSRNIDDRTPTFALNLTEDTMKRLGESDPRYLTSELNKRGVACSHGNHYAVELVDKKLGLTRGVTRLSFLHYNTLNEVDAVIDMIEEICK